MYLKLWRFLFVMILFVTIAGGLGTLHAQPDKPDAVAVAPQESEVSGTIAPPPAARAEESPEATILNEGFEGTWPAGLWTRQDNSTTDGGEYLWDDKSCWPHTGNWGAYSVGGGANGSLLDCWEGYPNNANTWTFWGPFNLSNATAASFTFYYHGITEGGSNCPFDRFLAVHVDDNGDYNGRQFCGEWITGTEGNDYYTWTVDLASRLGDPTVWIAFALQSDGSDVFPGMMIDDVRVNVTTASPTCYQLSLDKTGQGSVPTASPGASSGCTSGRYTAGQTINLTAGPAAGWRVGSWTGTNNNGSTANTNTITMPASTHTARVCGRSSSGIPKPDSPRCSVRCGTRATNIRSTSGSRRAAPTRSSRSSASRRSSSAHSRRRSIRWCSRCRSRCSPRSTRANSSPARSARASSRPSR